MTVSREVREQMQQAMEAELRWPDVKIPGVDMEQLAKALAKGICNGLEEWERELTQKFQQKH